MPPDGIPVLVHRVFRSSVSDAGPPWYLGLHGGVAVRIVTMNIWGPGPNWDTRRPVLVKGFRDLQPDLVALQETIVRDGYDQARDVLGEDFTIVHQQKRHRGNGVGVSIASRWPVRETHELDLHLTKRVGEFPATTLVAEIDAPPSTGAPSS